MREGTLAELLLIAAASLRDVWTLEDVTVQAHLDFPARFAMHRYPELPSDHRVHSLLYGARGLVALGLAERANGKTGSPWFRLTEAGRQIVAHRRAKQQAKPAQFAQPTRPISPVNPRTEEVLEPKPIVPAATELNLWRIGKKGEACLRLIERLKNSRRLASGREVYEALIRADEETTVYLSEDCAGRAQSRPGESVVIRPETTQR